MEFKIDAKKILIFILLIIGFLIFANSLTIIIKDYFNLDKHGLIGLFYFDAEKNIPTLFSSLLLIFCAFLLASIAHCHRISKSHFLPWLGLSIIFIFLAIDETAALHEKLITPVRAWLDTSGPFYYAWVIPYGVALIIFIICYLPFLIKLPKQNRILFILSGSIYVAGVLFCELLGGVIRNLYGNHSLFYMLTTTIEESLEMLGLALFAYSLLNYLSQQFKPHFILVDRELTK